MKLLILVCVTLTGSLGGWLGAAVDHGNWFGLWSILFSTAGSLLGVWIGFKAGQNMGL